MLMKVVLILILAASTTVPFSSQAQSPAHNALPVKPPLPFPANAAGYQWTYKCPPGKKCIIFLPGQSFDLAVRAIVVLVMFPVGNAIIPSYFWWVTIQAGTERTGFIQNPSSFTMTVSPEFILDSTGPIGPSAPDAPPPRRSSSFSGGDVADCRTVSTVPKCN
jgi:hypothetical protein